jgi:hypothetical protein
MAAVKNWMVRNEPNSCPFAMASLDERSHVIAQVNQSIAIVM